MNLNAMYKKKNNQNQKTNQERIKKKDKKKGKQRECLHSLLISWGSWNHLLNSYETQAACKERDNFA